MAVHKAISGQQSRKRLRGRVRLYLREQGFGFIEAADREFRFRVIDVQHYAHPVAGDRVSFVAVLEDGELHARQVRIETPLADSLSPASPRHAVEKRPESAELVRARRVRAPVEARPAVREHVRCGCCQRLVLPRMRPRKGKKAWEQICPRCGGPVDGRRSSLRKAIGATAAAVGGALVITRTLFF